jgi:hypothetical protein
MLSGKGKKARKMITIGGKQNGTPESPRLPSEAVIAPEICESA